jgi:hypothetical protein
MAWTDDSGPQRSRDELLDDVVRRGRALRRRRQLLKGGLAGLLAATLAVPVLVLVNRNGPAATTIVSATGGSGTTSTADLRAGATAVDAAPEPSPTTTTTAPPAPPTTARPRTVPTAAVTTAAPPPTSAAPVAATTTTQLANCGPADLAATATTDKAVYAAGETVKLTSVIRNSSLKPCIYGFSFTGTFRDAAGKVVSPTIAAHGDYFDVPVFAPGQTYNASHEWNQLLCSESGGTTGCPRAPAGTYAGIITWRLPGGASVDAPAGFRLG